MRFHVLTLFPQMIEQGLSESITGRALKQNIISLNTVNIRDFAHNKHNKVDDYTYGGGAGMLMQAEPVYQAVSSVVSQINKCNQVHSGDNSEKNIADENILYEDIIKLMGLPEAEKTRLGSYSKEVIEKYYSIDTMADDAMKMYVSIIKSEGINDVTNDEFEDIDEYIFPLRKNKTYDVMISGYYLSLIHI